MQEHDGFISFAREKIIVIKMAVAIGRFAEDFNDRGWVEGDYQLRGFKKVPSYADKDKK